MRRLATTQEFSRSSARITKWQLARLLELADEDMARLPVHWRKRRAGVFLAQGAAQHFVDGVHGVEDFDVWSFFWADRPSDFPWKGPRKRQVDFGRSPHGRNLYTPEDRAHPWRGPRIRTWEQFEGRRVDLMTRTLPPNADDVRAALRLWLLASAPRRWKSPPAKMPSAWWLARRPVVELWPSLGVGVWNPAVDLPPGVDPLPKR
jgi:hypothetical protein